MDLFAVRRAARHTLYVLVSIQASACTLQNFDELDKTWGVGGQTGDTGESGATSVAGSSSTAGSSSAGSSGAGGSSGGTDVETPPDGNLMANPSFESGHSGWTPFGMSTLSDASTGAHSGQKCLLSSGRSAAYMGPSYQAASLLTRGASYAVSAWLRMVTSPDSVQLTLKSDCDATTAFTPLAAVPVDTEWTKLDATLHVPDCQYVDLTLYFEGPVPEADFWLDDVFITPQ
jgi:hypothetical protein